MPTPSPSPYSVLGIDPSATATEVRLAYQRALRSRPQARAEITQAFNQLRNPTSRLGHDLMEPASPRTPAHDAVFAEARAHPFVDAESVPLPSWESLVVLPDPAQERREVPPPVGEYRTGRLLRPPGADVLPPFEFPV